MSDDKIYQWDAQVDFGGVSIGDQTASIGITIERDGMDCLDQCDELFCGRRLEGKLQLNKAPQRQLPGMEGEIPCIETVFDVKHFSVKPEVITIRATFSLSSIRVETLGLFAKQAGQLWVNHLEDLADADDDEYEDDGPISDAPGQGKMFGTEAVQRQKEVRNHIAKNDQGALKPISALGLTKAMNDKMIAAGVRTVGDLEHFIATDSWWHRKIKGVGETSVDKINDALWDFRRANPVPADDDDDEETEVEHAETNGELEPVG